MLPLPPRPGDPCPSPLEHAEHVAYLDWYDGPLLVLMRNGGALYLALWSDVDDETHRWLVVRISRARFDALAAGAVTLATLFASPEDERVYVLDASAERTFGCTRARPADVVDRIPGDMPHPREHWHEQPDEASLAEVE